MLRKTTEYQEKIKTSLHFSHKLNVKTQSKRITSRTKSVHQINFNPSVYVLIRHFLVISSSNKNSIKKRGENNKSRWISETKHNIGRVKQVEALFFDRKRNSDARKRVRNKRWSSVASFDKLLRSQIEKPNSFSSSSFLVSAWMRSVGYGHSTYWSY